MTDKLTDLQLTIIMHVCNGWELAEIADELHYSVTNISYHLRQAKYQLGARNTAHLVSIVIASGALVWTDDGERAIES